jgi:formylglycine-generating enzyme required for sulfatase activity
VPYPKFTRTALKPAPLFVLLAAVVAIAAMASHGAASRTVHAPPVQLGSEAACNAYGGLPRGWGSDRRAGMVRVEGGDFTFGSVRGYADERPAEPGQVHVAGFWIDQTEVTVAQFAAFVHATGYVTQAEHQGGAPVFHVPGEDELRTRPLAWWRFVEGASWRHPEGPRSATPAANLPVTLVTQADAFAYARWLGRDLPTEAEWEYAAKAGRDDAGLDTAPRNAQGKPTANYWQGNFPVFDAAADGHHGLAPVGCYAANPWYLYDTIGNVWEWTRDAYTGPRQPHANGDTAAVLPAGLRQPGRSNQQMVIKGGSFLCSPDYCVRYRASAREAQEADRGAGHIGFRTVLHDG